MKVFQEKERWNNLAITNLSRIQNLISLVNEYLSELNASLLSVNNEFENDSLNELFSLVQENLLCLTDNSYIIEYVIDHDGHRILINATISLTTIIRVRLRTSSNEFQMRTSEVILSLIQKFVNISTRYITASELHTFLQLIATRTAFVQHNQYQKCEIRERLLLGIKEILASGFTYTIPKAISSCDSEVLEVPKFTSGYSCLHLEVASTYWKSLTNTHTSPCCSNINCNRNLKIPNIASASVSDIEWCARDANGNRVEGYPWDSWLGIGISIWFKTGSRLRPNGCMESSAPLTSQYSDIDMHSSESSDGIPHDGNAAFIVLGAISTQPIPATRIFQRFSVCVKSGKLVLIVTLLAELRDEYDILVGIEEKTHATVTFPFLPGVSEHCWHHVCVGVVTSRSNQDGRKLMIWLDGVSASCLVPGSESTHSASANATTDHESTPNNSSSGRKDDDASYRNKCTLNVSIEAPAKPTVSESPADPTIRNYSDATYTLDIASMLVFDQPISLAHIAMVLFGAGPGYSGIFVGESGDGSVPLQPSLCSHSLLEAMERKIVRDASGTGGKAGGRQHGPPQCGAYADVEPGPLVDPKLMIGCTPSQVLLSLSRRWRKYERNLTEDGVRDRSVLACLEQGRNLLPMKLSLGVSLMAGALGSDAVLQLGAKSLRACLDAISAATSCESLTQAVAALGSILSAATSLRGLAMKEHLYAALASVLGSKAAEGLVSPDCAVEIGKLCCCVCPSRKKKKKKLTGATGDLRSVAAAESSSELTAQSNIEPNVVASDSTNMGTGATVKRQEADKSPLTLSLDILLVDPALFSILIPCVQIWNRTSPEAVAALMNYLQEGMLAATNSFMQFNRRQLARARGTRGLILLLTDPVLQRNTLLSVLCCLETLAVRDFLCLEDIQLLVAVLCNLAMISPGGEERSHSHGESDRGASRRQGLEGLLASSRPSFNESPANGRDRVEKFGVDSTDDEYRDSRRSGHSADAKYRTESLILVRHAVCALLAHITNISHCEMSPRGAISSPIIPDGAEEDRETRRLRRSKGISTIITTFPLSRLLYSLTQFADISPSKPQVVHIYGPTRAQSKRRDPFTGLLHLQLLATLLPHTPGAGKRSSRSDWGADLETCLPGLLSSLLAHGSYAVDDASSVSGTSDDGSGGLYREHRTEPSASRKKLSKDHPPQLTALAAQEARKSAVSVKQQQEPLKALPAVTEMVGASESASGGVGLETGDALEDSKDSMSEMSWEEDEEGSLPLDSVSIDESVVSSLSSRIGSPAPLYASSTIIALTFSSRRRRFHSLFPACNSNGTDAVESSQSYFVDSVSAVLAAEDASTEEIVVLFLEVLLDILLGYAGASAELGDYLLNGWNVADIEPLYIPQKAPPPVPLPSFSSICGSPALGAFLAVAREAARGSTQVSLLYSRSEYFSKFGSWPHYELERLSSLSLSLCVTMLCALSTLLRGDEKVEGAKHDTGRGKEDDASIADESSPAALETSSSEDFDVLSKGLVQIFFASAKAQFLEALGPGVNVADALSSLSSEAQADQIPNEILYRCCGTTIGRLTVQQLTFLTLTVQSTRGFGSRALDWDASFHSLPAPSHPVLPKPVASAFSLILNAAIRRRHLSAVVSLTASATHVGQATAEDSDVGPNDRKQSAAVTNPALNSLLVAQMGSLAMEQVLMEAELNRQTAGGLGNPEGRYFIPLKNVVDLCRRVIKDNKLTVVRDKDVGAGSIKTTAAIALSTLSATALKGFSLTSRLLSRSQDSGSAAAGSSAKETAAPVSSAAAEPTQTNVQAAAGAVFGELFRLGRNGAKMAAMFNRDIGADIDQAIGCVRLCLGLFFDEYRGEPLIMHQTLTLCSQCAGALFSWRRSVKEEEELAFVGYILWRLNSLLYEDSTAVRATCMRVLSLLLRSSLGTVVRSLLQLPPPEGQAGETIDLWSYDAGGFSLLYTELDVLPKTLSEEEKEHVRRSESHPACFAFQAWLGSLSETVRSRLEEKLSDASASYRGHIKTTVQGASKSYSKRWQASQSKVLQVTAQLASKLHKVHGKRRKEMKESQAAEMSKIRRWRQEQRSLLNSGAIMRRMWLAHCRETGEDVLIDASASLVSDERTIQGSQISWAFRPENATVMKSLSAKLNDECGVDVLSYEDWIEWNKEVASTRYPLAIASVRSAVGEWALDQRHGPSYMRTKIRRGGLALVALHDNGGHQRPGSSAFNSPTQPKFLPGLRLNNPELAKDIELNGHNDVTTALPFPAVPHPQDEGTSATESLADLPVLSQDRQESIPDMYSDQKSLGTPSHATQPPVDTYEQLDGEQYKSRFSHDAWSGKSSVDEGLDSPVFGTPSAEEPNFIKSWAENRVKQMISAITVPDKAEEVVAFLQPGDSVMHRWPCYQVVGMDNLPSQLIVGDRFLYVYTSSKSKYEPKNASSSQSPAAPLYFWDDDHRQLRVTVGEAEVWMPWLAGRNASSAKSFGTGKDSAEKVNADEDRSILARPRKYILQWSFSEVTAVHRRRHMLSPTALELFLTHGRSSMLAFVSLRDREEALAALLSLCPAVPFVEEFFITGIYGTKNISAFDGEGIALSTNTPAVRTRTLLTTLSGRRDNVDTITPITESWVNGSLSNFDYLMHLNVLAGRTYSDWSQYPVFPWVLSDYSSPEIDLSDPTVFRDLSKPMGALSVVREREARKKYTSLFEDYESNKDPNAGAVPPFHYGTHYSSSGIVLHYLIRLQPFSSHAVALQGGRFDRPDRLFHSVQQSWMSASGGVTRNPFSATATLQDVKELIPEFFYLPDFLVNMNGYDFGRTDAGVKVDTVQLPPWAHGSPREFIRINRAALESPYVSAHLHLWIDLIFGSRQRGRAAEDACNVFHFLTYEGSIDLSALQEGSQRAAYEQQIRDFGQTPVQLFKTAHPARKVNSFPSPSLFAGGGSKESENTEMLDQEASDAAHPPNSVSLHHAGSEDCLTRLISAEPDTSLSAVSQASGYDHLDLGGIWSFDFGIGQIQFHASDLIAIPENCLLFPGRSDVLFHWGLGAEDTLKVAWFVPSPTLETNVESAVSSNAQQASSTPETSDRLTGLASAEDTAMTEPENRTLIEERTATGSAATGESTRLALPPGWVVARRFDFGDKVGCIGPLAIGDSSRIMISAHKAQSLVHIWRLYPEVLYPPVAHSSATAAYHESAVDGIVLDSMATCIFHSRPITSLAICVVHDMFVSGCSEGVVVLWSLSTLRHRKILPCSGVKVCSPITAISIDRASGDIFIASGNVLIACDINGRVVAAMTNGSCDSKITCMCCVMRPLSCRVHGARASTILVGDSTGTLRMWNLEGRHSNRGGSATSNGSVVEETDLSGDQLDASSIDIPLPNDLIKAGNAFEDSLSVVWELNAFENIAVSAVAGRMSNDGLIMRVCAGSFAGDVRGWDVYLFSKDVLVSE